MTKQTTQQLQAELDELLQWFESEHIDLDEAVTKYKRGTELIKELQKRLENAENVITTIARS